jgi:hypothetical protein
MHKLHSLIAVDWAQLAAQWITERQCGSAAQQQAAPAPPPDLSLWQPRPNNQQLLNQQHFMQQLQHQPLLPNPMYGTLPPPPPRPPPLPQGAYDNYGSQQQLLPPSLMMPPHNQFRYNPPLLPPNFNDRENGRNCDGLCVADVCSNLRRLQSIRTLG